MGLADRVQLEFCCEKDLSCRNFLEKVHEPKHMYHDIAGKGVASMPEVDLYTAGFPCQPWSRSGLRQGRRDKQGRGNIFHYVAEYIYHKLPKVCLLENVASLTWNCHHEAFQSMLATLRQSGKYFITWRLLNAADFGIPQNRPRVFIMGFLRSAMVSPGFLWPTPTGLPMPLPVERFLCGGAGVFAKPGGRAEDILQQGLQTIREEGGNPNTTTYALDLLSGRKHPQRMVKRVPCLTRNRAGVGGYYITSVKRMLTVEEMLHLMGLPRAYRAKGRAAGLTDRQIGLMVGNAIATNVLQVILGRALHMIGKHQ